MLKGIILAGGVATRLQPATTVVSKQLLPVYDKPMIYYPLTTLLTAGVDEILIITNPENVAAYHRLFGDGSSLGVPIKVISQTKPRGIADALIRAEETAFVDPGDKILLVLGDNLFIGESLLESLVGLRELQGARLFLSRVRNPQRYGVGRFHDSRLVAIDEKPATPASEWAVTGLYGYDYSAVEVAYSLKPSERGELEITDLNNHYIARGEAAVEKLSSDVAWFDMGTAESLLSAAQFVQAVQSRTNRLVGCPELVAFHSGRISEAQLVNAAERQAASSYGMYLYSLLPLAV